ncbi:MAG: hypothetical protein ACPGJV_12930 [Bacteriovoracaceae bacterium]
MSKILLMSILMITFGSKAQIISPGAVSLFSLVSDTASTAANTLKILQVAKETSDQIDKYNIIAVRQFHTAKRIENHIEQLKRLNKLKVKDHKSFNRKLAYLKQNIVGLKNNIDWLAEDVVRAYGFEERKENEVDDIIKDEIELAKQEKIAAMGGSINTHVQNIDITNAITGRVLNKMRSDNRDYQLEDISIKRSKNIRELRRKQELSKWLGDNGNEAVEESYE